MGDIAKEKLVRINQRTVTTFFITVILKLVDPVYIKITTLLDVQSDNVKKVA
jgi:hypothetical protein|tara:strand:+ start:353 stop:508 length:156 start_codon:yes stop_codon:yes gene_type:complete